MRLPLPESYEGFAAEHEPEAQRPIGRPTAAARQMKRAQALQQHDRQTYTKV
jgi:hypothetical protein